MINRYYYCREKQNRGKSKPTNLLVPSTPFPLPHAVPASDGVSEVSVRKNDIKTVMYINGTDQEKKSRTIGQRRTMQVERASEEASG